MCYMYIYINTHNLIESCRHIKIILASLALWVGIKESGRPKPALPDSGILIWDSCPPALYTQLKEQTQTGP